MILLLAGAALLFMASKKNGVHSGGIVTPTETQAAYVQPWVPYPFTVFNGEGQRNASEYVRVLQQFKVANNPRYAVRDESTYCNIFVWDFTCATGCEIPHWVDAFLYKAPVGKGREQTANDIAAWLNKVGRSNGWSLASEFEARRRALNGYPTLVVWRNDGGIGHVAVVVPSSDINQTFIAQAGIRCFENEPLSRGFGNRTNLQFWSHD